MIYRLIRLPGKVLLELFFKRITVGGEPLVHSGPLLIVANHPNFFFDPALLAVVFKRPLWFLAKGTLFAHASINWLLRGAHLVPIYRREDGPAEMTKNDDTFRFAARQLADGRAIALFPEGVSKGERILSPIKTGAARIALQTELETPCGLQIQPVGITYADLREFQTSVTLVAGKPIAVAPFLEEGHADDRAVVRALTNAIDTALRSITVEIEDDEDRELAELIGKLYSAHGVAIDDRSLLALIGEGIAVVGGEDSRKQNMLIRLRWYHSLAGALGFDPGQSVVIDKGVFQFLALPFVLFGIVFHIIPYRLVGSFVNRSVPDCVETATAKLALGVGVFLAWYAVALICLTFWLTSSLWLFASFVFLLTTGYFALKWTHKSRVLLAGWLAPGSAKARMTFYELGEGLFAECEQYRKQLVT